jgi:CNT family concentrative nucleoside transporter
MFFLISHKKCIIEYGFHYDAHSMNQAVIGIVFFPVAAWLLGGRPQFSKKKIGLLLMCIVALTWIFLKIQGFNWMLNSVDVFAQSLQNATQKGTDFVFGPLGLSIHKATGQSSMLFFFNILPVVIVTGVLSALMVHFGILAWMTKIIVGMTRFIPMINPKIAISIFFKMLFSQIETTLFMRNNLRNMDRNEIVSLMAMGMSTTTLSLVGFYATLGDRVGHMTLTHIVTSSVVNIFSALALTELMIPSKGKDIDVVLNDESSFDTAGHAFSQGAIDGWSIVTAIASTMIASIALMELVNYVFGWACGILGYGPMTVQQCIGTLCAPLTWIMGVDAQDAAVSGVLLAEKTLLNETVALTHMAQSSISLRTCSILMYSVCSFSNILSVGAHIALWKVLCPEKVTVARPLAFKALIVSILAGGFSGCVASFFMA